MVSPHLFRARGLEVVSTQYWGQPDGYSSTATGKTTGSNRAIDVLHRLRACEIPKPVHYVVPSSEVLWLTGYGLCNRPARAVLQDITDDESTMGFHPLVTDDYIDNVWDECHCCCRHNPPAPIWLTQYTAIWVATCDLSANGVMPHHQILWRDRLCPVTGLEEAVT